MKKWKRFGLLLLGAALLCFVVCVAQSGQNSILLSVGMLCNSLAWLVYILAAGKK